MPDRAGNCTVKSVAILQSNYLPWKGYFDIIAAVDEFIVYDEVQFTKNDWRNRNRIKTQNGVEWISIPVGQAISRRICEVELPHANWQVKHWKTLVANYARSAHFNEVAALLEPLYLSRSFTHLSSVNVALIRVICAYLEIGTTISDSAQYPGQGGKSQRLVSICEQSESMRYVSGPAAKSYLDEELFRTRGIEVSWFDYSGYPAYPQRGGAFEHGVSVLDLLFNCGRDSRDFMLCARRGKKEKSA